MPNFAQQHPTAPLRKPAAENETEVVDAESVANLEIEDPVATLTQSAAGTSIGTSQQPAQVDAIGLLVKTVRDFEQSQRRAAAAGVSAAMRQVSPQFNVRETEYRSFRRLVEAAEQQGLVSTTQSGSDIDLHAVGDVTVSEPLRRLDNSLWRAFLEWNEEAASSFDRSSKRVVSAGADSEHRVAIPSIPQHEQVEWMKEFAAELPQGAERETLLAALNKDNSAGAFSLAVRNDEKMERAWRSFLQRRVLDRAQLWARENRIPVSDLTANRGRGAIVGSHHHVPLRDKEEAQLRERVLTILGAMPLSELLKLPIPIEYTLLR